MTAGLAATLMCLNVDLTYDRGVASGVSFAEGCKIESRAVDKGIDCSAEWAHGSGRWDGVSLCSLPVV